MMRDLERDRRMLNDLNKKLHSDITRAMSPTLDLVGGEMGNAGIYSLIQKTASVFVEGAAMALASMRGREVPTPDDMNNDDVWFVGIVAMLTAEKEYHTELLARALETFERVRGYPYKLPYTVEH